MFSNNQMRSIRMKTVLLRFQLLAVLFSFFLLQGCEKEEDAHPEVQTLELVAISPATATLHGTVVSKGRFAISDHGFIYGYAPDLNEFNGVRHSLGKDAPFGKFSGEVSVLNLGNNYYGSNTLYARAYLKNEKGTTFGQIASVMLPSANVQGITPSSGKAGDRITISGKFFASSKEEVHVTFANASANVVEVTATKIVVEVPVGIVHDYYYYYQYSQIPVNVTIGNQTFGVTSTFRVNPTVKDFAPKAGPIGTSITISGDNLPSSYYYSYSPIKVYLGNTEATIASYSSGGVQILVPSNVSAANFAITVVVDGVSTVLPGEFSVTPHTISSVSPASGLPGSTFSVFGNNLTNANYYNYYDSNFIVRLGDVPVPVQYYSTGQLMASVPVDMSEGDYKVSVTAGPHTVEAPQTYKVLAPSITGISPSSGGIGREVVLSGVFLEGQYYTVYFGTVPSGAYAYSASSMRVQVPAGIEPGKVKVYVQHGNRMLEAEEEFTVLAPTISSFAPSSGVAGSEVVITGSGFTPDMWYTTVKFGTVSTTILSITENKIRTVVPSGVSGAMKISVVHNGHTIISKDNFTVTN